MYGLNLIKLTVVFFREDESIIAYCPALDLSACGRSIKEAQKNFQESLKIYIEETVKHGTLEKDLKRLGWRQNEETIFTEPAPARHKSIPYHILKQIQIPVPAMV